MANQLLRDTDIFDMTNSLEIRVPFVDHVLVEYLAGISVEYKLNKDTPKKFLIKALHCELPRATMDRPKMTFALPFDLWLREELKDFMEESLFNSTIFNHNYVKDLWADFLGQRVDWARPWALVVLGKFLN
ncbi:MAG: asparagine synthase-related protein [Thermodesulfobacteriota bacterium]